MRPPFKVSHHNHQNSYPLPSCRVDGLLFQVGLDHLVLVGGYDEKRKPLAVCDYFDTLMKRWTRTRIPAVPLHSTHGDMSPIRCVGAGHDDTVRFLEMTNGKSYVHRLQPAGGGWVEEYCDERVFEDGVIPVQFSEYGLCTTWHEELQCLCVLMRNHTSHKVAPLIYDLRSRRPVYASAECALDEDDFSLIGGDLGRLYLVGGTTTTTADYSHAFRVYDLRMCALSGQCTLLHGRRRPALCTFQDRVYVSGGIATDNSFTSLTGASVECVTTTNSLSTAPCFANFMCGRTRHAFLVSEQQQQHIHMVVAGGESNKPGAKTSEHLTVAMV